jgi:glycerophosphoryl diester phosphodiesterase
VPPTTTEAPAVPAAFGTETVVVGHRGAAGHHPDNSLEGFAAARDLGATWVELDVRLSADGDVVLSHDPETAAGSVVAETPTADLVAEGLVPLTDALDVVDENALGVDVEIKALPWEEDYDTSPALVDATLAVLDGREPAGPIVISSFDRGAIDRVLEHSDHPTMFITPAAGDDPGALANDLLATGHDGVAIGTDEPPTAAQLGALAGSGLTVWAWTVDDPDLARQLVDGGATGIVTDLPDEIAPAIT